MKQPCPSDPKYDNDPQDKQPELMSCTRCHNLFNSDELAEFYDCLICFDCYEVAIDLEEFEPEVG